MRTKNISNTILCFAFFISALASTSMEAQEKTTWQLDNGLHVTLIPLNTAKKNSLVVLYDIGNRFDPAGKSGLSHLAEHLYVTAATEKTKARNVQQYMAKYPDGWNAQTGDDYTVIATVFHPDRNVEELADAADRMKQIVVDQSDLDRELPRIETELSNMYEGFLSLAISNHGRHYLDPLPNQGRRGGKMETLSTVTVPEVQRWFDDHYKPTNARLILAGAFDAEEVKRIIEESFGLIRAGEKPTAQPEAKPVETRSYEIALSPASETPSSSVGYTFQAPDPSDDLFAAYVVHATMLMIGANTRNDATAKVSPVFRLLDDPQFFYLSTDVMDGESSEGALKRIDEFLAKRMEAPFKQSWVKTTENGMSLFLGTREMPPAMQAFNTYGVAFAEGRRRQMGLDSASLKTQFEELDDARMKLASEKFFKESNRITVIGTTKTP